MVRGARWVLVLGLLLVTLWSGVTRQANGEAAAAACQTFPQTGKQVCEPFLTYWQQHGGLAQQGLPISDAFNETNPTNGQIYLTQYFERARFEYHPEIVDPQYQVLLGLLGSEQFLAKYPGGRPATPASGEGCFPETGRCVEPRFLAYWLAHGGLAQQGLPISDAFDETSPTDGQTYRVQYFERARFEDHPEIADPAYRVLLGLLGREQFLVKYPSGQPTGPAPTPTPAPSAAPTPAPSATPALTAAPSPLPTPSPSPSAAPTPPPAPSPSPSPSPSPAPSGFNPNAYTGQGDKYNCGDFASQAQAQAVLRADPRDPNKLDTNKDGIACESNPAPKDLTPVPR